ncbi:MAG: hypothetical protein R3Y06_05715, partial [Faecalibacterium sp.]
MPNSKFFVGSYVGDVTNRNANYASCDWSNAVRTSCQPEATPTVTSVSACNYTQPSNPYTYAKQPVAVTSNYYAPLPIINPCDYLEEPVIAMCPTEPSYPSCGCHYEPTVPECPVVPECSTEP